MVLDFAFFWFSASLDWQPWRIEALSFYLAFSPHMYSMASACTVAAIYQTMIPEAHLGIFPTYYSQFDVNGLATV